MISQVKSLYDKYEVDMEMWDYRIEPYLSYAGGKVIDNTYHDCFRQSR